MENKITFYVEANGKVIMANQSQVGLFSLLSKLKIKSAPKTTFYMISTSIVPIGGWYTVSCNVQIGNGLPQVATQTFSSPPVPAKPEEPKKKTKLDVVPSFLKPKKWNDTSKIHSRSTGR